MIVLLLQVNTASRMETYGEPLKIHISESTKNILDTFNMFVITLRGEVEIKVSSAAIHETAWHL